MSRRKHRHHDNGRRAPAASGWIWGAFLGVLAGGVVFTVQSNSLGIPSFNSGNTSSTTDAVNRELTSGEASTTILLAIPNPKADRDEQYAFVWPEKTLKKMNVEKSWRGSEWIRSDELYVTPASPDGKAPILADGGEWKVPLRISGGAALEEPVLVGMADTMHVYVMARASGNHLYLVSRSGDIRSIHDLPDFMTSISDQNGDAWLASYVPGEGLESEPSGPSRLLRYTRDGVEKQIAEETQVIVSVLAGPSESVAWQKDGGDMTAMSGNKRWIGTGLPLAWIDMEHLLLAQGRVLFVLSFPDLKLEQVQILPAEPSLGKI